MSSVRRLAVLVGVIPALVGCPQGPGPYDHFVGVNLIADQAVFGFPVNIPLQKWVPDDGTYVFPTEGDYLRFEPTAEALPPGAPPAAQVWRLEIKNLVPNGDFEATVPPAAPAGWLAVGGATLETVAATPESLDGVTMRLSCADGTQMIDFDVRAVAADGFAVDNTYLARFDYRTNKYRLTFEYNNAPALPLPEGAWTWSMDGDGGTTFPNRYSFPPPSIVPTVTVNASPSQHFFFNSLLSTWSHKTEAYIDNFRLVRTNQTYFVRMSIADGEAALPLVAGTYRLSIWVKRDPVAAPNRFASSAVQLSLVRTYRTITGEISTHTAVKAFRDGVDVDLSDGQWHQVHVVLPNREWQTAGATVSMEVGISPTDETLGASRLDCGSILVAAPALEMLPDSY